jgi:transcription antitermination factor NusG
MNHIPGGATLTLDKPRAGFVTIGEALHEVGNDRLECGRYSAPWYVACTEWGQEALARGECLAAEIQTFLPLVRKREIMRDGKVRHRVEAAFPGYLFVMVEQDDQWHHLKRARGIAGVLHAVGDREKPAQVRPALMAAMLASASPQGILEALSAPPTDLARIAVGQPVRINHGWLAGMVGVCTWSSAQRVALLVEAIGQRVTLQRRNVEPGP